MHGRDGGNRVYMKKNSAQEMTLAHSLEGLSEWIEILEGVEQDPVLQDLVDRVIVYHRLKRKNDGKSSG